MSQNSIVLATTGTVTGLAMAQAQNAANDTLASCFLGAAAPNPTYPGQWWVDTGTTIDATGGPWVRQRNSANSAWVRRFHADVDFISELVSQTNTAFTAGGTAAAATLTPTPALATYAASVEYDITFPTALSAGATLQISGLASPPNLVRENGDGTLSNIGAGDVPAGHRSKVVLLSAAQALVRSVATGIVATLFAGPSTANYGVRLRQATSGVNGWDFMGSASGIEMNAFAQGADTNIGMRTFSKGTGRVVFGQQAGSLEVFNIDTSGNSAHINPGAGLGYGPGAGGTVTQATSKSTTVTLNKPTGQITMNNAALASGASVVFSLNNSVIGNADTISVNQSSLGGTLNAYQVNCLLTAAGYCNIRVTNISGGSLSEAVVINFAVIKGATA